LAKSESKPLKIGVDKCEDTFSGGDKIYTLKTKILIQLDYFVVFDS